jgi:ADP-ribose pyrophosphatase YjhB (NUDIX family)
MSDVVPHTHCHACGSRYVEAENWPRTCQDCGTISWGNPIPAVAVIQPVQPNKKCSHSLSGLLVIKRGIEPGYGLYALPGGHIEHGESWRTAAVRELREETGTEQDPNSLKLIELKNSEDNIYQIAFVFAPTRGFDDVEKSHSTMMPTREVLDVGVMFGMDELAFPTHTEMARAWFKGTLYAFR